MWFIMAFGIFSVCTIVLAGIVEIVGDYIDIRKDRKNKENYIEIK